MAPAPPCRIQATSLPVIKLVARSRKANRDLYAVRLAHLSSNSRRSGRLVFAQQNLAVRDLRPRYASTTVILRHFQAVATVRRAFQHALAHRRLRSRRHDDSPRLHDSRCNHEPKSVRSHAPRHRQMLPTPTRRDRSALAESLVV